MKYLSEERRSKKFWRPCYFTPKSNPLLEGTKYKNSKSRLCSLVDFGQVNSPILTFDFLRMEFRNLALTLNKQKMAIKRFNVWPRSFRPFYQLYLLNKQTVCLAFHLSPWIHRRYSHFLKETMSYLYEIRRANQSEKSRLNILFCKYNIKSS